MITQFLPPVKTYPAFNPNLPAPETAAPPTGPRPQQSADRGDRDRYEPLSIANNDAVFQVFSTPLTSARYIEVLKDGAQCGRSPETANHGDFFFIVRNSPTPTPDYDPDTTETIVTVDAFGVIREQTRIIPGAARPMAPEPTLTVTVAHPVHSAGYGRGLELAVLGNGEWVKLEYCWNNWALADRGVLLDQSAIDFEATL